MLTDVRIRLKGGAGSGNFGHGGRPGEVGGSATGGLSSGDIVQSELDIAVELGLPTEYHGSQSRAGFEGKSVDNPMHRSKVAYDKIPSIVKKYSSNAETVDINISDLTSPQDYVQPSIVLEYRNKILDGSFYKVKPIIATINGERVILNGTHTILAAQLAGLHSWNVRDLGNILEPEEKKENVVVLKIGTQTSGFRGHAGREGHVGGSASVGGVPSPSPRSPGADPAVRRARRHSRIMKKLYGDPNYKVVDPENYDPYSNDSYEHQKIYDDAWKEACKNYPNMNVAEFVSNSYEFDDPESGLHSEVTTMDTYGWYGDGFQVKGGVFNSRGEHVGEFTRIIRPDSEIHNDYFRVQEAYGKSGFGSRFYRNAEKVAAYNGIEKITISANLSVGGYAWARMGFDFSNDSYSEGIAHRIKGKWWEVYGTHKGEPPVRHRSGRAWHSWELAAVTGPDGRRIGKEAMLGSSWDAVKYLNPRHETSQVGEAYYATKQKK